MVFQEHRIMLCLSKPLYLGFIQLQADRKLGRSFAGLLPFVEGLFKLGYINKEVYEAHKRKYSVSLVDKNPSLERLQSKRQHDDLVKQFSNIIKSWPTMKAKSKIYWVKKAQEHQATIKGAKLILELAETKVTS